MTPFNTSSPQAITYIQDGGSGEELKRLPEDSEVTGYSGGGAAFENDNAGGDYQGTRITANRGRFTFDLSARRTVASILREQFGNSRLFNVYVLETDKDSQINGFADFREGQIFVDTGITNESTSASVVVGNSQADPGTRDVLSLSAGTRVEIRQPTLQDYIDGVGGLSDLLAFASDAVYVPPLNRQDPRDQGRIFAVGPFALSTCDIAVNTTLGAGSWESVPNTGIAANNDPERIIYTENHLFLQTTNGGVDFLYIANLKNYGTANFRWNLVYGLPSSAGDISRLIAPGNNVVVAQYDNILYVSRDGGYSFSVGVGGLSSYAIDDACAIDENNIFWVNPTTNTINHVRNLSTVRAITVPGSGDLIAVAVPKRGFELFVSDDAGAVYRTRDISASVPQFELVHRDVTPGAYIHHMAFVGVRGAVLVMMEQSGSPTFTRILVDYSGGVGGNAIVPLTPDYPLAIGPDMSLGIVLFTFDQNHFYTLGETHVGAIEIGIAKG